MRHRLSGLSTSGLNGLDREMSTRLRSGGARPALSLPFPLDVVGQIATHRRLTWPVGRRLCTTDTRFIMPRWASECSVPWHAIWWHRWTWECDLYPVAPHCTECQSTAQQYPTTVKCEQNLQSWEFWDTRVKATHYLYHCWWYCWKNFGLRIPGSYKNNEVTLQRLIGWARFNVPLDTV